jgi:hypothetical protein
MCSSAQPHLTMAKRKTRTIAGSVLLREEPPVSSAQSHQNTPTLHESPKWAGANRILFITFLPLANSQD